MVFSWALLNSILYWNLESPQFVTDMCSQSFSFFCGHRKRVISVWLCTASVIDELRFISRWNRKSIFVHAMRGCCIWMNKVDGYSAARWIKYITQKLVMRHEDLLRTNYFVYHRQFLLNIKIPYLILVKLLFNSLSLSR